MYTHVGKTDGDRTRITVSGLREDTDYHFKVFAENKLGTGPALETKEPVVPKRKYGRPWYYWLCVFFLWFLDIKMLLCIRGHLNDNFRYISLKYDSVVQKSQGPLKPCAHQTSPRRLYSCHGNLHTATAQSPGTSLRNASSTRMTGPRSGKPREKPGTTMSQVYRQVAPSTSASRLKTRQELAPLLNFLLSWSWRAAKVSEIIYACENCMKLVLDLFDFIKFISNVIL